MATQIVTPVENVPENEVERLIQTVFGSHWIKTCVGKLTPEQLDTASMLAGSNVESMIPQIKALGHLLGSLDKSAAEASDVHAIGWTITHLAEYVDTCRLIEFMAQELKDPEVRQWRLAGTLNSAA